MLMGDNGKRVVGVLAAEEMAATQEPGDGLPHGSQPAEERIGTLLILQRVDRVEQRVDHLGQRVERFEGRANAYFAGIDGRFASLDSRFFAIEAKIDNIGRDMDAKIGRLQTLISTMLVLLLVPIIAKLFFPQLQPG